MSRLCVYGDDGQNNMQEEYIGLKLNEDHPLFSNI